MSPDPVDDDGPIDLSRRDAGSTEVDDDSMLDRDD